MKTKFILLYVTFPSRNLAISLIQKCLEKKLIACANILAESTSLYQWEGKIEQNQETIAILKTAKTKHKELESFIKEHHEYDCPCIGSIDIQFLNKEFSSWIKERIS